MVAIFELKWLLAVVTFKQRHLYGYLAVGGPPLYYIVRQTYSSGFLAHDTRKQMFIVCSWLTSFSMYT